MSAEEANDTQNMEKILEKEIAKKQESNGANSSKDENKEKTKDDGGFLSKIKNLFDEETCRFLFKKLFPENKDKIGFLSKIKNAIKNADFWWFFSTKMIFAYLPLMVYVLWKYLSGTNFTDVLLSESIFLSLGYIFIAQLNSETGDAEHCKFLFALSLLCGILCFIVAFASATNKITSCWWFCSFFALSLFVFFSNNSMIWIKKKLEKSS